MQIWREIIAYLRFNQKAATYSQTEWELTTALEYKNVMLKTYSEHLCDFSKGVATNLKVGGGSMNWKGGGQYRKN